MSVFRTCSAFLLPVMVLTSFSFSEEQQGPKPIKVSVNLVLVDVVVTGKKETMVTGLKKEDFEVFEDGKQQEILDFEFIDSRDIEQSEEPSTSGIKQTPPAAKSEEPSEPESKPESDFKPRNIFLFIVDKLTSRRADLLRMRSDVDRFLDEVIQPDDSLAVIEHYRGYHLTQNFTSDREVIKTALNNAFLSVTPVLSGKTVEEQTNRAAEEAQQAINQGATEDDLMEAIDISLHENDFTTRNFYYSLGSLCETLMPFNGRKTVVLISRGNIPGGRLNLLTNRVIDAANKANISIYSIDPTGLEHRDHTLTNPYARMTDSRNRNFQSTGRVRRGLNAFDHARLEMSFNLRDDGFTQLTRETGGRSYRTTNNFYRALNTAHRESRTHYVLSYSPKNLEEDGKFRNIKVRLKRGGYDVRYRRGYFATSRKTTFLHDADAQVNHALYSPNLIKEIPTTIRPAIFVGKAGNPLAYITVHMNPTSPSLTEETDRRKGVFTLTGGLFDEFGIMLHDFRRDFSVELDEKGFERYSRDGISVSVACELQPGQYQIKTVLRDNSSGKIGTQRQDLVVEPNSGQAPSMSSLVLSNRLLPRGPIRQEGKDSNADYEMLEYRDVVVMPSVINSFYREDILTFFFHAYNITDPADDTQTEYLYRLTLYKEGTVYHQFKFAPLQGSAEPYPNGLMLALRLPLKGFDEGEYQAKIEIAKPDGSNQVARTARFQVQQ